MAVVLGWPVLALKVYWQAWHLWWLKSLGPSAPPHQVKLTGLAAGWPQRGQGLPLGWGLA